MKYLFITLDIQDGERKHTHRVLHTTPGENIEFAAQRYVADFWGWGERYNKEDDFFWFNGEITGKLSNVVELSEYEYKLMSRIFSGDKDRNDYFQIVSKGYEAGLQREEVEINLGENGKLMLYKTPEGSVVDVYNQDDEVNTMTIWEDDLTPMPDDEDVFDPNNVSSFEIDVFVNEWGQKHNDLCDALGYNKKTSDDIIMLDFFWYSKTKKWIPKNVSLYSEYQQAMADYLKSKQ
jgi:hypothetical protein